MSGRDLTQLSHAELKTVKATYGVTFQQGALFTSLTVLQNVQLPMLEHLQLSPRALEELAMLKVRLVGLPDEAARQVPGAAFRRHDQARRAGACAGARSAAAVARRAHRRPRSRSAPRLSMSC